MINDITPEQLLDALSTGYFPMAKGRNEPELFWFNPEMRGVLPLEGFHIPKSLKRFMKQTHYTVTIDKAFNEVITACADTDRPDAEGTWINDEIIALYNELHQLGYAHSVECWDGKSLIGGVYGVAMGAAFMGESMFSNQTNASKMALVHLVEHLKHQGFILFDSQYVNDHIAQFGAIKVPRGTYLTHLREAIFMDVSF